MCYTRKKGVTFIPKCLIITRTSSCISKAEAPKSNQLSYCGDLRDLSDGFGRSQAPRSRGLDLSGVEITQCKERED